MPSCRAANKRFGVMCAHYLFDADYALRVFPRAG